MSDLIHHLEGHLGKIVGGWSKDADGRFLPFQVVHFERSPIPGTKVLSTLGLSHTPLWVGVTGESLRQELVMMVRETFGYRNLPGVLQQIGLEALHKDRAYSLGDVLGPRGELFVGSRLQALYVALPVYFPDEFHIFRPRTGAPIVFGWLVPITARRSTRSLRPSTGSRRRLERSADGRAPGGRTTTRTG